VDVQSQWLPLTVSADCTHFPLLPTRPTHYFTRNSRLCRWSAFTWFFLSVSPLLRNATHVILFYHCFFFFYSLLLLFFYSSTSLSDDDDRDDSVRTHSGWLGKVVVGTALETAFRTYFNENVLCGRRRLLRRRRLRRRRTNTTLLGIIASAAAVTAVTIGVHLTCSDYWLFY